MSLASGAKKDCEALAAYTLMSVKQVAGFLGCLEKVAREMDLPWIRVGRTMLKVTPLVGCAGISRLLDRTITSFTAMSAGGATPSCRPSGVCCGH